MKRSFDRTASPIAAVVVVAALLTTACTAGLGAANATPASTTRASTTPAPSVAASSAGASTSPSPTAAALIWTPASLGEDWPAPVRSEPVGGGIVRPLVPVGGAAEYADPLDDTESSIPWVDIRGLGIGLGAGHAWHVGFRLAEWPPLVAPTERWIAYGFVVDTNRDGVPDLRYGIDNIPATARGKEEHRAWTTDLHTGQTASSVGELERALGEQTGLQYGVTFYSTPGFHFGGDTTGPPEVDALSGLRAPFYAWASMIEDGRVVATDYAPDLGWLDPSAEANR